MSLRVKAALLCLAIAPATLAATTAGPDKFHLKPGAKGKGCVGCHPTFEDTLKLPFVHTPVKAGECTDCHNPHASSHGKLLAEDQGRICLKCHADISPPQARSAHPAVVEGACVKCHDPHGAKNKGNVLAAGSELCFGCHKEMATQLAGAKFKHSPVEKSCLGCHDPHASSKNAFLLKKSPPELCTGCHPPAGAAFVAQHMNYPVGKADCTSCHDPHGASSKGILWASVHAPVSNKMCNQCHGAPGSPDALKMKKAGYELCRGCHNDMINDTFGKPRIHWPVVGKAACLNCHTPHASKTKSLLLAAPGPLCGGCHAAVADKATKSAVKHKPVAEGQCDACHAAHSSDGVFLLKNSNVAESCGACHDWQKHSTHPIGDKVIDKRNKNLTLDCLSCHLSHGSAFKSIAPFDPKADLCVQCHAELKR